LDQQQDDDGLWEDEKEEEEVDDTIAVSMMSNIGNLRFKDFMDNF